MHINEVWLRQLRPTPQTQRLGIQKTQKVIRQIRNPALILFYEELLPALRIGAEITWKREGVRRNRNRNRIQGRRPVV